MPAPYYTALQYLAALQAYLPRGRVWPKDLLSTQAQALSGLTPAFETLNARANQLIAEALPSTTYELMPEWQETLGLPDPCAGPTPTLAQQRAQIVARFTNRGGQSISRFVQYAAQLGYAITITQFTPARAGMLRAGYPVCGVSWAHAWQVNAASITFHPFAAGQSAAGQPLTSFGNAVLECELLAIAPAHTTVIFKFH